jgi:membrane protein
MIQSGSRQATGILATIIGMGTLLLSATGAFTEIQSALNVIWRAAPSAGFSELVRARLVSLGLVATLGFLMLVSLVVSAGLTAWGSYLNDLFPGGRFLMSFLNSTLRPTPYLE